MKVLTGNQRYAVSIFVTILIVLGVYSTGYADITPMSDRTPQVAEVILNVVKLDYPSVSSFAEITATHLAAPTTLYLNNRNITALESGDFDGLTGLTELRLNNNQLVSLPEGIFDGLTALGNLNLYNNQLSSLPDGIFEGLTSLTTIRLGRNTVDPLLLTVSLEKVAGGQFKAVAPTGTTFDFVLPISVTNGSITGGASSVTILQGSVESETFTVTRTTGTTTDVTVDIGTLPSLPRNHYGYALVKSDDLPLAVITSINTAPIFTDGTAFTRTVAENTAAAVNIGTVITATDTENDTLTYTLSGNPDASAFDIDSSTGQLKTKAALDYETKNVYTVTITVSDGSLTDTIAVTINVTDVDEVPTIGTPDQPPTTPTPVQINIAPEFVEGDSTTRVVLENTPAGVNIGTPMSVSDSLGDLLAYTLSGVDADSFDIDSGGQLKAKVPLDYETKRVYLVTITVDDEELFDTITVIIYVIDVNDTVIVSGFVPVADRTPQVRDAIVAAIPGVTDAAQVTAAQLATITNLNLRDKSISLLKTGDFFGLTALTNLNLFSNQFSSLPSSIFDGLTALTTLRLGGNAVDPLPLIVSLQSVGEGEFKAVITTGAPFNIVLPITVTNGSISGGTISVMIPQGSAASASFTVIGTSAKVSFGYLPGLPNNHYGYTLAQSTVCNRTEAVADAIAKAVGVTDCSALTEVDLATITSLDISGVSLASLAAGDFDGMLSLRSLYLGNNELTGLPSGIFDDLVSLRELFLNSNKLTTLSGGIFSNLTSLTNLYLQGNDLSSLSSSVFDGLSSLKHLGLEDNELTSLSGSIFVGIPNVSSILLSKNKLTSLPAGIFEGLSSLSQLHLSVNSVEPLPLVVSLQKVGTNQFKAVVPIGAPFAMTLPVTVQNGTIAGGTTTITIPIGRVESQPVTVTRTPGAVNAVTANIGNQLPRRPATHNGYVLVKSTTLPIEVIPPLNSPPVFTEGATTTDTIAENTAAGTNIGDAVIATDVNTGDTLTYTLGGTDAAAFDIDSATGQLKTKAALDYETQNAYSIVLTVSDGRVTDTITVTINISNVNEAPVFAVSSSTTHTVAENTAAGENIGSPMSATDDDGDTLSYSLSGTDAGKFSIDSTNGQLRTNAPLDYETKTSYTVTITASDSTDSTTITVTINVINKTENRAPVFSEGSSATRSVAENTGSGVDIGSVVAATDDDGDTLSYSLSGTDASSFSIDSTIGQLKTGAALNFEDKSSYTFTITVSDETFTDTITVTINVTDANDAPIFTDGESTSRSVAENTATGNNIGSVVAATDADNDTLTYSLSGTDASSFSIDSTIGQLKTGAALNFEDKSSYTFTITVSDETFTDTITVMINVTDANDAPIFTDGENTSRSVAENTANNIGSVVAATDADNDTLTYSLSGTDASSFSIDSTSGQLQTSAALDYETKSSYTVTVSVSDGKGGTDSITVTINVTDVSEVTNNVPVSEVTNNVPVSEVTNNVPVFADGTTTTRSVAENTAANTNIGSAVSATDDDGDTLSYSLSGTDVASFGIVGTSGQLQTSAALDYETKSSYSVTVSVSDMRGGTDSITVTINVTDVSEVTNNVPVFADGTTTTRSVAENTAANTNIGSAVSATDADNDTLTYTLGGTDAASFGIVGTSGQLQTSAALDYETKSSYTVTVSVSDMRGGTDSITVTINVTDANDAPIFTDGDSTSRSVAEDTATGNNIGSVVAATDADDGDTLTYTLSGTDAASFSIDSTSGQLQTLAALNFEDKSSYTFTITVSDETLTDTITVTINVTNANDAPIFTDGESASRSVAENTATGNNIGSVVAATDADDGDTLTYTLSGTDAASFSIDSTSGQLQTLAALNFEDKSSYTFTITVSDETLTDTITVTINVTNANDAPIFTDGESASRSVAENTATGNNIGSVVAATDADDGDTLTYTLSGTDAASFSIDSTSGQLQTLAALNFEDKSSYTFTITVSDETLTDTITVTINVTNANDAPIFTDGESASRSVAEDTATGNNIGSVVAATDADDGDTLTYTLSGTDAASFGIDSTSGQLQTLAALNFEDKSSYTFTITVSDETLTDTITVTINVTNANDAPIFTDDDSASRSVAEDTATGNNIGSVVAATDADDGDTLTYTLSGTDAASFGIVGTSGQLQTSAALDYETKSSYTVTVSVSDGKGGTDTITVTINVTDANDAPIFTDGESTSRSVAEDTATGNNIGSVVAATDADNDTLTYSLSGTDVESFGIVGTSGQLQTSAALDYETKSSYTVTVSVSDGKGGTDTITVTINVADVSETPVSDRTQQVQDAIVAAVQGVESAADVTATHLAAITSLNLYRKSITSLKAGDFDGLTALTTLDLSGNIISDISPLENLTNLTTLDLGINSISDISPLENLTNLTTLDLGFNNMSDISPLENLTNLTTLDLFSNIISDISPLKNLTNLTTLDLSGNNMSDISPLDGLTALTTLDLGSNIISDISPLEDLTSLTALYLEGNTISDYGPLRRLIAAIEAIGDHPGLTIDITINDAPIFTDGESTSRSVAENTATGNNIGSVVAATDVDNDTLTYSLDGTDAASFSIISISGQLQTSAALDYETKSSYTVTVSVSDGKGGTDSITVTINVTSDNAPVFADGTTTTRSVAENTAANTNIGSAVSATDADNDTLTYTLGGTDVSSFGIVGTSGQLQTSAALDYETKLSYTVTVSVSDGKGSTDSITVTINVTDANDAPIFTDGESTSRSVAEDTATGNNIGSVVAATDVDNDTLTYSLDGTDAASFSIISISGQLQTSAALDYETKSSYTVTVSVSDGKGSTDSITVTINVTDANDAPIFTDGDSTSRSVAENTATGNNIGSVVAATDVENDTLTYSLDGTDAASFSIISISGQLQTSAALDYETKSSYTVTVSVSDGKGGTDSITVTINVTDANDAPIFTDGDSTSRSVAENTATGNNIGSVVAATDVENDTLTYSLDGTDAASFSIISISGQLQTSAALDYETKSSYTVTVSVSDGKGSTDSITVTINVTDANDAPIFTDGDSTSRSVAENTATGNNIGSVVAATDADDGDTLTYSLDGTDAASFSIISISGQLQTSAALDYETKSSYTVTVSVSDGKGGTDSITVTINVTDANDAPIFTDGDSTSRSVAENTATGNNIGSVVAATDVDNDTLTYSLDGTDAASFSIISISGQLQTSAALDYETKSSYTVTVSVSDGKGGTDSITVTINVTSDNAPVFADGTTTTRSVAENTAANTNIGSAVSATDADNDTLTYTLGGTDVSSFGIVGTSGQLQTSAALDYETKLSYTVTVSVSDGKGSTDSITVTINVTDANDAPIFTDGESTSRSVAEDTATGNNIGSVVAATDDDGDTLSYSLSGTDASSFSIDSTIGQLKTGAALNFEDKSSYTFTITVSDETLTDTITVTINVTDANDAPIFTDGESTSRSVAENTATGNNIGSVVAATDDDGDTLSYSLSGTDASSFSIDSTIGQLKTGAALNFEDKSSYTFTITVSDETLTDTITVTINVTDANDAPIFTDGESTSRSVAENTATGNNIGSVVAATDVENDTLTYSLDGTDAASFSIISISGQLQTSAALDYETKSSYTVTVSVSDGKGGTDSITVTINVTSDNAPVFADGTTTTRSVAENTAANTNIGSAVSATDADNDTLTYTLGGTDVSSFGIVGTSGQLQTSAALDYETKLSYTVTVSVSDGKGSTDTITVTINVTNANDAPIFTEGDSASRSVAEDTATGNNIGSVVAATDADDGDTLTYTLSGTDAASFSIDSTSGQLQTLAALNFEDKSSYTFTITVSDETLTDTITVTINVTDANEAPIFTEGDSASRSVAEDTATGNNIGSVVAATDADDGDTLTYTLSGTDAASFSIDSTSGQLQTLAALNFEDKSSYTFTITVSDETLTDTITVTINVTNANDAPIFTEGDSASRSVAEDTATGNNIGSVVAATDADDGDTLTYTLSGTDAASFSIDSTSGQLQTLAALNFEDKSSYTFTITVSDETLTDTITVTINVTDANDAPIFTEGDSASRSVAEDTATGNNIGSVVAATDDDGDTLSYSLSGTDASSFSIDSTSGQLKTGAALNFEDKSSYTFTITVSDETLTDTITVTINVTDANEAPIFTDGESTLRSVAENTATGNNIGSVVAATDDDGDTLSYSLSGTDASSFSIDSTSGQLKTGAALNFEDKSSYTFTITVSDETLTDTITVTINVTDANEAPIFTDGESTLRSVAENTATGNNIGSVVAATDDDGDTLSYSLSGTDAASFSIDSTSGQLQTLAALNFEDKSSYTFTITVSDETLTDTITVTINVTDANEAPIFTEGDSASRSVAEDTATGNNIGSVVAATDADDGDTLTYTLSGTDAASFSIDSTSGQLQTLAALNFEDKSSYTFTITVSDETLTDTITVTINVTDANDAPIFTDGESTSRSVAENTATGNNIGSVVAATDADNDTLTYSLSGTDVESFGIVGTSGQLQTSAALDYETKSSYTVTVSVSDEKGGTDSITVTINVADVSETPVSDRTQQVQDAIVAAVQGVDSAADVTATHLAAITSLNLYRKSITSLKAGDFDGLTALTTLDLSSNNMSDISPLENLTNLTTLDLFSNIISDISPLKNLTNLTTLDLFSNIISDISPLAGLTNLTTLDLGFNSISDISPLAGLTNLTTLNLNSNNMSDILPLENLTNLTTLNLNSNNISNILPLENLTNLTTLDLFSNIISDISPLAGLTSLTALYLEGNTISDYEPLRTLIAAIEAIEDHPGLTIDITIPEEVNGAPTLSAVPTTTALLANFPNPFNPETWIPYQLSKPAKVTLTIYSMRGVVVRQLELGHQSAGVYRSRSRAVHWDGRNMFGEKVAAGVYFYTLEAGDFTATRKMLIRK